MRKNRILAGAIVASGRTQKEVAAEMGINCKVFYNKLNRRKINGNIQKFKDSERETLAAMFGISKDEIE